MAVQKCVDEKFQIGNTKTNYAYCPINKTQMNIKGGNPWLRPPPHMGHATKLCGSMLFFCLCVSMWISRIMIDIKKNLNGFSSELAAQNVIFVYGRQQTQMLWVLWARRRTFDQTISPFLFGSRLQIAFYNRLIKEPICQHVFLFA